MERYTVPAKTVSRKSEKLRYGANLSSSAREMNHEVETESKSSSTWKSGKAGDGSGKQHENLTAMLVGVVTVFIICQLPGLGIRVAFTAMEFGRTSSNAVSLDVTTLRYANVASNALQTY